MLATCAHSFHSTLSEYMKQSPMIRWNYLTILATCAHNFHYLCELIRISLHCNYGPHSCIWIEDWCQRCWFCSGSRPKRRPLHWTKSYRIAPRCATIPTGLHEQVYCRCIRNANTSTSNSCFATFFEGMMINESSKCVKAKLDCVPTTSLECKAGWLNRA